MSRKFVTEINAPTLRLTSTADLSTTSIDHGLQVGPDSGLNLRFDNNEIQCLTNGVATGFWINYEGGQVRFGAGGIEANGQITIIPSAPTLANHAVRKDYVDGLIASGAWLTGTSDPTSATGATGNFYARTAAFGETIFGPKNSTGYTAGQYFQHASDPTVAKAGELGTRVKFRRSGQIYQIYYRRQASDAATLTFNIWNNAGALVATVSDTQSGLAGTFFVTLPTPVTVAANDIFTVSVGGAAAPYRTTTVYWKTYRDLLWVGSYNNTTANTFPNTYIQSEAYAVGPVFRADEWWPTTVNEIPFVIEQGAAGDPTVRCNQLYVGDQSSAWGNTYDMWGVLDVSGTAKFHAQAIFDSSADFGSAVRQMINLYGTTYGIGVQSSTTYWRSNSGFAMYMGGVHSGTAFDPGAGGLRRFAIDSAGVVYCGSSQALDSNPDSPLRVIGNSTKSRVDLFHGANANSTGEFGYRTNNTDFEIWNGAATNGTQITLVGGTTGVTVTGNGKDTAMMRDGIIWVGNIIDATGNSPNPLRLYGTATQDYISFYHGTAPQSRSGYVGFNNATQIMLYNEISNGNIQLRTNGTTDYINFFTGGVEGMRLHSNGDLQNGANGDTINDVCAALIGRLGQLWGSNAALNTPALITNKTGAGNAAGADVAHFRMANTTRGTITHPTTTTTAYNTSSDYRLKDVLGPVDDPVGRLMLLKPCHVRWKENGEEMDTFIAHEVKEIVNVAVTGEKDAVDEDGEIIPQQLDASKIIPLLTAAVQELAGRVEALETA